jgi:hypothetical protein
MPSKSVDPGRHIVRAITAWAQEHAVPLVTGHGPEKGLQVHLTMPEDVDLSDHLCEILEQVTPYLIVASPIEFTSTDLEETLVQLAVGGADPQRLAAARACSKYVGRMSSLRVGIFIKGGPVILIYTYLAVEAAQQRAREQCAFWTPAARKEAARRIANDPRFPSAKKEADRVFLTRDVLGADAPDDDNLVVTISREASAIYSFEIAKKK